MNEIFNCVRCGQEVEFSYGDKWAINDYSVVSETPCKCKKNELKKSDIKPLDQALIKLKGLLNESTNRIASKVPVKRPSNT